MKISSIYLAFPAMLFLSTCFAEDTVTEAQGQERNIITTHDDTGVVIATPGRDSGSQSGLSTSHDFTQGTDVGNKTINQFDPGTTTIINKDSNNE